MEIFVARMKFKTMSEEEQAKSVELLNSSPNGTDSSIDCDCGGKLVVRTSSINGRKFLGCTNFPKCKEKLWQKKIVTTFQIPNFANRAFGTIRDYGNGSIDDYCDYSMSDDSDYLRIPTSTTNN